MEKIDFNKTLLECIGQSKPEETNNDFIIRCMQAAIEQDRKGRIKLPEIRDTNSFDQFIVIENTAWNECITETKRINGID